MRFLGVKMPAPLLGLAVIAAGCGNVVIEGSTDGGGSGGSGGAAPTTTSATTTGEGGAAGAGGDLPVGGAGGGGGCPPDAPDQDSDGDGFSPLQGDCNDCDPKVGPGAVEAPTPEPSPDNPSPVPVDEDCDGLVDEPPETCDDGIAIDAADPLDAARAIELCSFVSEGAYHGVLDASWRQPDRQPLPEAQKVAFHRGHGILPDFGPKAPARAGSRLLAISNGTARRPIDPEYALYYMKDYFSESPPGMPFEGPCLDVETGAPWDGIALQVQIVPPVNALGLQYDFRFYTRGWPKDACLPYNDQFAVLMSPPPVGALAGNIAFDQLGNPLTISWLTPWACSCNPQQCPQDLPCLANKAELTGSGFDDDYGASTDWLTTSAPVDQGAESFTLRFLIYDAEDGLVDSTAILDNFRWIATPPQPIRGGPPDN